MTEAASVEALRVTALAVRFALELGALAALGLWGSQLESSPLGRAAGAALGSTGHARLAMAYAAVAILDTAVLVAGRW